MSVSRKFVVKKDAKTDAVIYMEYDKRKGFKVKPKHNIEFENMINVNEMVIINPGLIKKLIDKKCNKHYERILKMLKVIYEDDDGDDDTPYMLAITEMQRLRDLIYTKYKEYMEEEELKTILKKLELLEQETEERRRFIIESQLEYELQVKKGKSSR